MATPVEHYETAEHLLDVSARERLEAQRARAEAEARDPGHLIPGNSALLDRADELDRRADDTLARAGVHATLSNAPWALDDRVLDEVAAGLDGEQVGALLAVIRELGIYAHTTPAVPTERADAEPYVIGLQAARREVALLVDPILKDLESSRQA